jgi:hypothetical protein
MSERARMSTDALQNLNVNYASSVTTNGKVCLEFANATIIKPSSDDQTKDAAQRLWRGSSDNNSFSKLKNETLELLANCLSGTINSLTFDLTELLGANNVNVQALSNTFAHRNIRKQAFGYLNMHELIFDLVRQNKIDTRIICNQLAHDMDKDHPLIRFINEVLIANLGKNEISGSYPGLTWYAQNLDYCSHPTRLWFENSVFPLVPFMV